MTEGEYLRTARKAAKAYLEALDSEGLDDATRRDRSDRWEAVKASLSPVTLIQLVDTALGDGE